jgi:hypothetical protein
LAERREKRKLNGGKLRVDADMLDVLLTHQEKESKDGRITDANIGSVIWVISYSPFTRPTNFVRYTRLQSLKDPNQVDELMKAD